MQVGGERGRLMARLPMMCLVDGYQTFYEHVRLCGCEERIGPD